ncbi:MAG: 23S rRNA (uracil(1939)-C(5))-methyltransferase RlmD [Steroidobacteraceae bacterium]
MTQRRRRAPSLEQTGIVASLNTDGFGVIRDGKAAFIAGALPGEQIRYQRMRQHSKYDEAQLLEVLQPAAERVVPGCRFFGVCGGCALQHMDPVAQLAAKQVELQEALRRIGQVEPAQWLAPLQGPVWHYRRRARLGAKYVRARERVLVGFRERLSGLVAAIDSCEVLAQPVGDLLAPLGAMLTTLSIRDRVPQIEVAIGDNQTGLVVRVLDPPSEQDLQTLVEFERTYGLRLFLQPGNAESVVPLSPGDPSLSYRLPQWDLTLQFRPTDFIQINPAINRTLIAKVIDQLQLDGQSQVLDLFCGLGNFTLPIARHAANITGVEGDAGLVQRGRDNATANGLANVEFNVADLSKLELNASMQAQWQKSRYSHVLLDPPRTGAREILPLVAQVRPRRVVYVSCHPGSLARDVGILVNELGFRLEAAGAIDMFPHTTHVESIAVLSAIT